MLKHAIGLVFMVTMMFLALLICRIGQIIPMDGHHCEHEPNQCHACHLCT